MNPIVAIIGRPNVGKSTLFNRIIGKRKAITLDRPGVTRDRNVAHAEWNGRPFTCIDTGGAPLESRSLLVKKIQEQIDQATQEANVVLFVVDAQAGLLPEDEEIYRRLRKRGRRVVVAVNKIDQPSHEERLADFYPLTDQLYPVSAEHGYRVGELLDVIVSQLPRALFPAAPEDYSLDASNLLERSKNLSEGAEGNRAKRELTGGQSREISIAIIGRPNVGKSSLLNHLLGEERVVVDEEPGTTRDVIDTVIQRGKRRYRLLDTAGIRRKGKREKLERYSIQAAIDAMGHSDLCLFMLDATEGIHKQDAHVAGLIQEKGRGVLFLWNKWDFCSRKEEKKYEKRLREGIKFFPEAPVLFVSAKTGEGCGKIWEALEKLYRECGLKISTSRLNALFEQMVAKHNVPTWQGKPVKFYYTTQVGTHPPSFLIFVSEPKGVHFSYQRYLASRFREAFGFGGAPLRLLFRRKS